MRNLKLWSLLGTVALAFASGEAAVTGSPAGAFEAVPRPLSYVRQARADGRNSGGASYTKVDPSTLHAGWNLPGIVFTSTPVAAQGRVYIARSDGAVFSAVDAATGAVLWDFSAPGEAFRRGAACRVVAGKSFLYVASSVSPTGGVVYCLRDDGGSPTQVWKTSVPGIPTSDMTWAAGKLYVTTGALVCLDAATGTVLFSSSGLAVEGIKPGIDASLGYAYIGAYLPPPLCGGLACVDAQGQVVWEVPGDDPYLFPVVVDAVTHRVYANVYIRSGADAGCWLRCYDGLTGTLVWDSKVTLGGFIQTSNSIPVLGAGKVFVGCYPEEVVALDAATGALVWMTPGFFGGSLLLSGDGKVWAKDGFLKALQAFDAMSGQFLGQATWTRDWPYTDFCSDEAAFYANEGRTLVKFLP